MKKTNKFVSVLIMLSMLLSILPAAVYADTNKTAVTFSAQKDGAFLFTRQAMEVRDGLAEEYGYTMPEKDHNNVMVEEATVFDALVAVHKAKYGEEFTRESAKEYLDIVSGGSLTKMFGQTASATGFFVNGIMPNDGIVGTYGTTGYSADTARLSENDNIEFWFYQDEYYTDYYTYFTEAEKNVYAGEEFTLTLKGFMAMSSIGYDPKPEALNGADGYITVNTVNEDGSIGPALTDSEGSEILINGEGQATLSFGEAGTYIVTANGMEGDMDSPITAPWCVVTVEEAPPAPEKITIVCDDSRAVGDTALLAKTGDVFTFKALDQNGEETPVTWSTTSSWIGSIDENTGILTTTASFSSGSTSYASIKATSAVDKTVSSETSFSLIGYMFSEYQKNQTVALSEDGQSAKTVSVSGGYSGHTIWSFDGMDGIAKLSEGQELSDKKSSVKFDALRPGTFTASFEIDTDSQMTDTAAIKITGVAVEDNQGKQTKTYLTKRADAPNPTVQLTAYTEPGKSVTSWSSEDEGVATVDENGLVTAVGVGSAIITATASNGAKGGIKVVVQDAQIPYFENLQFLSSAIKDYNTAYKFTPANTEYELDIRSYSTSSLTIQNTTLYDAEKYIAYAQYTDINGEEQKVSISSGAVTYLKNIPFDSCIVLITLEDKTDAANKTIYNFKVTRPRDTTRTVKNSGASLSPYGRGLLPTKYNGYAEGTMFKLTDDGEFKTGWGSNPDTGVSPSHYLYKCFAFDGLGRFSLNISGITVYEHLRYSSDNGQSWKELPQGGGTTEPMTFNNGTAELLLEIIDDAAYSDNVKEGKDGFDNGEKSNYKFIVQQVPASSSSARIITASAEGDWYPPFEQGRYSYTVVVPKDTANTELVYTVSDAASVTLGSEKQAPDAEGRYKTALKAIGQTITVTSADGSVTNSYSFKTQTKKDGYPDSVADYLCVNSQYTIGSSSSLPASPWTSLSGSHVSLGNFGGYITYYYKDALTNNPNNKYGIDFYVYGNANKDTSTATKTSFFEPAQAWVSENGTDWYALAGSAHYDDGVDWDYSVTYSKRDDGKTSWTDSRGNSNTTGTYAGVYPSDTAYYMNNFAASDSMTLSGVMLPAGNGEAAVYGEASDAYPVKWGYADCFVNSEIGADANPYLDNSNFDLPSSGFDLEWAVDKDGVPVDVSDKEFHYIKLQTVSNIWHSSFGDKSPEIAGVMRTREQAGAVGRTAAPLGVTITDGADTKVINFTEDKYVYDINLGDMKYVSVAVNDADEEDNIYINNQRVAAGGAAEGFKVISSAESLVRILVQNGDKEPLIYLLKLTGTADDTSDIIDGIKINAAGNVRAAQTKDGKTYTASVGYRISSVGIVPVTEDGAEITINGEALRDGYLIENGENTFTVTVRNKNGTENTITLKIIKDTAPASTGKIKVYFTLMGDDKHGDNGEVHTLKDNNLDTWISKTSVSVNSPATVLDVLEKALSGKYTFVNADGNYISQIDDLSEFANGSLSGWLYTLNGKYSSKGVAEQSVKNGDSIVFHYTDDYTAEENSEGLRGGKGSQAAEKYTVKFNSNGGTKVETQTVEKSAAIKKPDNPVKKNCEFDGWYTDEELTKPYDFSVKVTGNITLYAKWKESGQSGDDTQIGSAVWFTDVEKNAWYYSAVRFVNEQNIMSGISDTEFAPDSSLTRAMFAVILYRIEGEPEAGKSSFSDVEENSWYSRAAAWADENGIVNGMEEGRFAPDTNITREQAVTILYRYAGFKNLIKSGEEYDLPDMYTDFNSVSSWARDGVKYALSSGIITGRTDTTINPSDTMTRAEAAAVIERMIKAEE